MKILAIFFLFSILVLCNAQQQEAPKTVYFLGVLERTSPLTWKCPGEYCLEDGYLYKSTEYRLGDENLHSDIQEDISTLVGKMVLIQGIMDSDLNKITKKLDKAPENYGQEQSMVQIRSDWVREETGFHIGHSTKEKLAKVSFIRAKQIKEFHDFSFKKTDKKLEVFFANNFPFAIPVELVAQYETNMGKPQPKYKYHKAVVEPGKSISKKFSFGISKEKKSYRLHSIRLEINAQELISKLEIKI
ncbi:MAG: hypothetical protein HUU50_19875 [Candidatus Brocadiae bacterium]|nr:hypothetical protein [Candidatus Brocadiia bacterium]